MFTILPEFGSPFVPVTHTLKFEQKLAPASTADLEFEDLTIALEDYEFLGENYETLIGELAASDDESLVAASQLLNGGGHKLGGYPGFLQTDPRQDIFRATDRNPAEPFELLLRLVSTREINIGGFNLYFLIKRSDLLQCNFSNVVFYFDK